MRGLGSGGDRRGAETSRAVWLAAPAIVILATLGVLTRHQITYWHDSETLWKHTLSVTERNYLAHVGLAHALAKQGRIDEAIIQHNAAEAMHAYTSAEMVAVGIYEQNHAHVQDAIAQFERAVDAATDSNSRAVALSCLGSAFMQAGDMSRAKMSYTYALQQNPDNGVALVGSGLLAERDGDLAVCDNANFPRHEGRANRCGLSAAREGIASSRQLDAVQGRFGAGAADFPKHQSSPAVCCADPRYGWDSD